MTDLTAADLTPQHVGRYVRFSRPRDVDYGNPVISGPLTAVRRRRDGSGREIVTLAVGATGEVDLSPRHPVDVRHVWRDKPEAPTPWNIPLEDEPILHAKFHGGPADGQQKLIGSSTHEWDRQGVVIRADDGTYAYYEHSHIPDGVERSANAVQRKHGFWPTVLVGTVHMKYQRARSRQINEGKKSTGS